MANTILNFHFDYLHPSLILSVNGWLISLLPQNIWEQNLRSGMFIVPGGLVVTAAAPLWLNGAQLRHKVGPPSLIVLPSTNNNLNQLTFLKLTLTFASEREFQRVSWVSVKATYIHIQRSATTGKENYHVSSCVSNKWMIFTALQKQDTIEKSAADNFKMESDFCTFYFKSR